jgi:hypothetical protein
MEWAVPSPTIISFLRMNQIICFEAQRVVPSTHHLQEFQAITSYNYVEYHSTLSYDPAIALHTVGDIHQKNLIIH